MRHCWGTTAVLQTEEPTGMTKPPTDTHHSGTQSRPRTHTTRAHKARPGHTPLGHDKAARPHRGRAAVAVALGFEPRVAVTPHSISSAAPSAARTRYLTRILYYTDPRSTQIDRAGWEQGHTTPAARRPGAHEQARTPMGAPAVSETGLARVHTKGIHKIRTPLHATNNPQNTQSTQTNQAATPSM